MRRLKTFHLSILLIAASLNAQAKPPTKKAVAPSPPIALTSASIEGDVYLVMQSGDTKPAAGRTVYLLRDDGLVSSRTASQCLKAVTTVAAMVREQRAITDSVRLGLAIAAGARLTARNAELYYAIPDSVLAARRRMLAELLTTLVDSTGTGMSAHYAFRGLAPGNYALFAAWPIGEQTYAWFARAVVSKTAERRDLDGAALDKDVFCGDLDRVAAVRR